MRTTAAVFTACSLLGSAIVACTLYSGDVAAEGSPVTVALRVSTQGIDTSKPAGARELYYRLKTAARIVCTHANRVSLEPAADPDACSEKALAEAIRSAHIPLLTQAYLETHSLSKAAAQGIEVSVVPVQVATK